MKYVDNQREDPPVPMSILWYNYDVGEFSITGEQRTVLRRMNVNVSLILFKWDCQKETQLT